MSPFLNNVKRRSVCAFFKWFYFATRSYISARMMCNEDYFFGDMILVGWERS